MLARAVAGHVPHVHRTERGSFRPSLEHLHRLCEVAKNECQYLRTLNATSYRGPGQGRVKVWRHGDNYRINQQDHSLHSFAVVAIAFDKFCDDNYTVIMTIIIRTVPS